MGRAERPGQQQGGADAVRAFSMALAHYQAGRFGEAEACCGEVLALDPDHVDALHLSGVMAGLTGRLNDAVERLQRALRVRPDSPDLLNTLGQAFKEQGQVDRAIGCYRDALGLRPDCPQTLYNLGTTLMEQGRFPEAVQAFEQALRVQPQFPEVLYNLGNLYRATGALTEAVARYTAAVSIKPDYPQALNNLGTVLQELGRLDEAIARYTEAVRWQPDGADALNNLGTALKDQGRPQDAIGCYRQVLRLAPTHPNALYNLGILVAGQGQIEAAATHFRQALAVNPDAAELRLALAMDGTLPQVVDGATGDAAAVAAFSRALDDLAAWTARRPAALGRVIGWCQPFNLAYRSGNLRGLLSRYGDLACRAASAFWRTDAGPARPPDIRPPDHSSSGARIRLIIISGHIRSHSVWTVVLRGIVAHLDRRRFDLILYHTSGQADEETRWARTQVGSFIQGPRPMAAWLEQIRLDRPDVLFYPELGMDPVTGCLAALRLAPVQLAGWGHPVTTGLPTIDAYLSGALLEGPGADGHYRERLIRLPGTGVCTDPPSGAAAPVDAVGLALPADRRIVRFALCHTPYKFDPRDDDLYVRIAKAVGPCRFWLPAAAPKDSPWAAAQVRNRLATAFRAAGLDPDALITVFPWLSRAQFLGFLDEMDVYLDCPAFSGYTTAWQAVHRGLPVVTLEGTFLRQRLAAGLLRQIGQTGSLATTREAYIAHALRLAEEGRDPQRREAIRATWRAAARQADGQVEVIRALERSILALVGNPATGWRGWWRRRSARLGF